MRQKVIKRVGLGLGVLFIALLILFCCRNILVRQYVSQKIETISQRYNLSVHYTDIQISGLNRIRIDNLCVIPLKADTLLDARSVQVTLNLSNLLLLKADIEKIESESLSLQFIKKDSVSNFDFLYKKAPSLKQPVTVAARNYGAKIDKTLSLLFRLLPSNADMRNLSVLYRNKGYQLSIAIPQFNIKENCFDTEIFSTENGVQSHWVTRGSLRDNKREIEASLYSKDEKKIALPFLEYRWGASVRFDTLAFKCKEISSSEVSSVSGSASVSGLALFHKRISPDPVILNQGTFSYLVNVGKNYVELDSAATCFRFNKLSFNPYLRLEKNTDWHFVASVDKPAFPANNLFSSLPSGLFYNLEGLEAEGTLAYHFLLDVDLAQVDSLRFESVMETKNFRILKYGNTDFRLLNEPFVYTAYENGEPVRSFEIGEENPNFRPIEAISPILRMAIMQSEDGGFYHHNGFLPGSIREALIHDIKERRFARGGSTISMQLVKNVFLSRNKTIARKLEEAMIVWLIESNRLSSKDRMYEVYLNMAEWGPLVYGASEASHYYFNKEASALLLNEAIFLASIIPKPKYVFGCFTDSLQLKPHYEGYYQVIAERLVAKGLITEEEASFARPEINVCGPAKEAFYEKLKRKNPFMEEQQPEENDTDELPFLE